MPEVSDIPFEIFRKNSPGDDLGKNGFKDRHQRYTAFGPEIEHKLNALKTTPKQPLYAFTTLLNRTRVLRTGTPRPA
jgi:hypothetical protein